MGMLWPGFLFLLGLIPLLVGVYFWMLRRRRRYAVRYSSLALVREALPGQSRLRRHLPFALFLAALASLVIALGRPVASVIVPSGKTTIILAMDVSRSMCSVDIPPNRLKAAEEAALSFIRRQNSNTQIGIVAFAGFAELVQPPVADQEALEAAIESLITGRRTAIGSGILKSLDAIAEVDQSVPPSTNEFSSGAQITPVPQGVYAPDVIVLLTDGASNTGPLPLDAAQQAADRGIRVYTIGFGTANGGVMDCGWGIERDGFFGGGGPALGGDPLFGGWFRRGIDEDTLKQVSDMTGGKYYSATSAHELQDVFDALPTYLFTRRENTEISVAFTALGALLAALAVGLSLMWHPLP
jgi:Ca-activated chloride channel family protein